MKKLANINNKRPLTKRCLRDPSMFSGWIAHTLLTVRSFNNRLLYRFLGHKNVGKISVPSNGAHISLIPI